MIVGPQVQFYFIMSVVISASVGGCGTESGADEGRDVAEFHARPAAGDSGGGPLIGDTGGGPADVNPRDTGGTDGPDEDDSGHPRDTVSHADTRVSLDSAAPDATDITELDSSACMGCGGCRNVCADSGCTSAISGVWQGSYECNQGLTRLELHIGGTSQNLEATFRFSEHPSNPGVPTGSYRVAGSLACSGRLVLEPSGWLNKPTTGNYVMVGLNGTVGSAAQRLTGQIDSSSCNGFELTRRAP